jgi:hypothetical protein
VELLLGKIVCLCSEYRVVRNEPTLSLAPILLPWQQFPIPLIDSFVGSATQAYAHRHLPLNPMAPWLGSPINLRPSFEFELHSSVQ